MALAALLAAGAGAPGPAAALSDAALEVVAGGVAGRRDTLLAAEIARPFPRLEQAGDPGLFDLGRLNLATALMAGARPEQAAQANELVAEVLAAVEGQPLFKGAAAGRSPGAADAGGFHFEIAQFLFRLRGLYGPDGTAAPGRLSPANAAAVTAVFGAWARTECLLSRPAAMRPWDIPGSENLAAQHDGACWAAATLLDADPAERARPYADGSTPALQHAAWTAFLKRMLAEQPRAGTAVEYFSPTYAQYTLENLYLYADFAADPGLRRLARASLDLWWALWAQEQVDGVHGGSKTRTYLKTIAAGSPMATVAWAYFGLGRRPPGVAPGEALALASPYRPPPVVTDLAVDGAGRGSYDVVTRAPGLVARPNAAGEPYHLDPAANGILREAHITPAYVLGLAALPALPDDRWAAISSQNRWAGLVLAGGDPEARVVPTLFAPGDRKVYNGLYGVQAGGTQLLRSMLPPRDPSQALMRVWIGRPLARAARDGWLLLEAPTAYVAVRPLSGGWHWDAAEPRWMVPDDPAAAIVIHAAARAAFPDGAAFGQAVAALPFRQDAALATATPLEGGAPLVLPMTPRAAAQVPDARALAPPFVFRSPFVNAAAGSGKVSIGKDGRETVLDFTPGGP